MARVNEDEHTAAGAHWSLNFQASPFAYSSAALFVCTVTPITPVSFSSEFKPLPVSESSVFSPHNDLILTSPSPVFDSFVGTETKAAIAEHQTGVYPKNLIRGHLLTSHKTNDFADILH